jgi:serine/threonine-protein kinase
MWRASIRGRDLFVASIPVTASVFLAGYLMVRAEEAIRQEFAQKSQQLRSRFYESLSQPAESLRVLASFMEISGSVTREQFRLLAIPLLGRHRAVSAFEWMPYVREENRAAFEEEARAAGLTEYRFWETAPDGTQREAKRRPFYIPIHLMEPPSALALGYDLASDRLRLATPEKARDSGRITASHPFLLIQDVGRAVAAPAVVVYAPVYAEREPATVSERRAALLGFAAVVFRVAPLMDTAASQSGAGGLAFMLVDVDAPHAPALAERPLRFTSLPRRKGFESTMSFDFEGRRWSLSAVPLPGQFVPSRRTPVAVALAGLFAGLVGLALVTSLRVILRLKRQREKVGPYRLVRRLGRGAMGVVWEARHALLRRPTAVKLLAPGNEGDRALARFEREVQLTAGLTHPSTIAIYDYGRTADGVFYYAMELLRGLNLQQLVSFDGPLAPGRVVGLLRQACGALSEAHAAGLIHRDIKPANIMVCLYGGIADFVKILDFGLVKDLTAPPVEGEPAPTPPGGDDGLLSQDGSLLGTPLYMSPEGMSNPGGVDARSDIFALGAVGFFLLTGKPPFPGRTAIEIFKLARHGPPAPLEAAPGVPAGLAGVLRQCLSFRKEDRPATAEALETLLEDCGIKPWTAAETRAWWRTRGAAALEATKPGPEERESGQAVFPATVGASGSQH